jgi:ribulose-phosphate 3-epimerase
MQIIPTTGLQTNIFAVEKRVTEVKSFSRWIQVDVCDNKFAKGKTFELELLSKMDLNTNNILWDIHLMVNEPINWVEKCMFVGASRIIGQVEMMTDRQKFVEIIKNEGLEVGLAFDVNTEIKDVPDETDGILIMGRKAGFKPGDLDLRVFNRIELATKFEKQIAVDGGVSKKYIKLLEKAGANIVYSEKSYFELIYGKNN